MDKYLKKAKKLMLFGESNHLDEYAWINIPGTRLIVTNNKIMHNELNNGKPTYIAGIVDKDITRDAGSGDTPEEALADFLRKSGDEWK